MNLTYVLFLLVAIASTSAAFVIHHPTGRSVAVRVDARSNHFLEVASVVVTTIASSPLVALAEEADGYEYGAVDAPIGIAVVGGVLAVLTALLPLALKGGEEAFEEMKEMDKDKWGSNSSDRLSGRR